MSFELACCLLATAAALFYVFYPGTFLGRPVERLAPPTCASAKTSSTKIFATSISNSKPAKCPTTDYQSLKSSLQDEAATLLAEIARLEAKAATPEKSEIMKDPHPVHATPPCHPSCAIPSPCHPERSKCFTK